MKNLIKKVTEVDENYKTRSKPYIRFRRFIFHLLQEIFNFGIGWVFGLLSVQLVLTFFEEKGIMNLWGFWSDKMIVEESTLSIIEWLTSAVIGYVVMQQVNKLITKARLFNSNDPKTKD